VDRKLSGRAFLFFRVFRHPSCSAFMLNQNSARRVSTYPVLVICGPWASQCLFKRRGRVKFHTFSSKAQRIKPIFFTSKDHHRKEAGKLV
jgi:hypothetical protein